MLVNNLSITEARFLLNTAVTENDLLLGSFYELISLGALKIRETNNKLADKNEKYIVDRGLRFNDFADGYYSRFYESIIEYEESISDPERLREPVLTPFRIIEKVSKKSNKNFKSQVATHLKEKEYLEEGMLPWSNFKLTSKGNLIKGALTEKLIKLQKLLQSDKKENEQDILKLITELGPLVLLIENLDKAALENLKTKIMNSVPLMADYQSLNLFDAYCAAELICFDIDRFDWDIFNILSD